MGTKFCKIRIKKKTSLKDGIGTQSFSFPCKNYVLKVFFNRIVSIQIWEKEISSELILLPDFKSYYTPILFHLERILHIDCAFDYHIIFILFYYTAFFVEFLNLKSFDRSSTNSMKIWNPEPYLEFKHSTWNFRLNLSNFMLSKCKRLNA